MGSRVVVPARPVWGSTGRYCRRALRRVSTCILSKYLLGQQGVPPLTGDGSSFDLPLQTEQPAITGSTLFESTEPQPRGDRAFAIAGALVIGLLSGFAGGFVFGQRTGSVPELRATADVPTSAEGTFTEAAIPEPVAVAPAPVALAPVAPAPAPAARAPIALQPPAPGSIALASRPDGAQVFLDGASVGKTPLVVPDVKTGARRVRLEMAGHRTWATVVNVEAGTRVRVGASLERPE